MVGGCTQRAGRVHSELATKGRVAQRHNGRPLSGAGGALGPCRRLPPLPMSVRSPDLLCGAG